MQSNSKNPLVNLLSVMGQVAEHKSEKIQEHGGDEDSILSSLTDDEKKELEAILKKLQASWIENHREHARKNQ